MHVEPVDPVDPVALAEPAARLLTEVWQPPCLRYTPEYLRWHFAFPGPLGAACWDGGRLVGFSAATPRRVRAADARVPVAILSFVAVRVDRQGRGLAARLYAALLGQAEERRSPVVVFALEGSPGERSVLRARASAAGTPAAGGYRWQPLGPYPAYAWLPDRAPSVSPPVRPASDGEFLAVVERCTRPGTLWNDPSPDQLAHYRSDPRGRALVVVDERDGSPAAAATVVVSELITASGVDRVASLDGLFLPRPSAGAVQALLHYARERPPAAVTSSVVTCPNAHGLDAPTLRAVGLRKTQAQFSGHLFRLGDDGLDQVRDTNLEIV